MVLAGAGTAVRECYVLNNIIYLAFAASLALCVFNTQAYAEDDWDENPSKIKVGPNTIYMSGATIISLATFGSILGIRIKPDHKTSKTQSRGFNYIFGGITAVIVLQGILMILACCVGLNSGFLIGVLILTCVALLAIVAGIAIIHDL